MSSSKKSLRRRLLDLRSRLPPARRRAGGRRIIESLLAEPAFRKAARVGAYISFGSEVPTAQFPDLCYALSKIVAAPVTARGLKRTFFSQLLPSDPLAPGRYGPPEPPGTCWRPLPAGSLDIVVVPGIAFDRSGHRLGFGGGVYDRLLAQAPQAVRVGLAFECQVVPRLPRQAHDQPMDVLITEKRVLRWKRRR